MSLQIVVESAKALPNVEKFGTIDPYVQLKFAGNVFMYHALGFHGLPNCIDPRPYRSHNRSHRRA